MRARTKGRSRLKLRLGAIAPMSVAALLATTALIHPVFAQGSVQQFGAVVGGHPAVWLQNGAIGDGGTYPNGLLSAVGVTSNNSKSVWINDVSSQIGQPYHQFTMGLSPTTGAILDYEPIAGATALPLTLSNNGFSEITLGTTGTVTIPILQVGTLNFGSFAFTNLTLNGTTTNNGVITGGTITNIAMSGTVTVPKTGLRWNLANPQFAGPTTAQTPLWDVEALSVSGTLGCGTLCVRAPEYDIQSENIKDTVVMSNGAFVANHHNFYFFGPSSGGKIDAIFDMRQAGPLTPDVTTTSTGGVAQKQTSVGVFNPWLSLNNTAGGSIDGGGLVRPFGLAYGGNPKVTMAGQNPTSGVPGASLWAALVANGEVDLYIEPSQNSIMLSGIVTAGDTLSISISSAVNPGFGTVTVSTVMGVGDALQFATQRLCGSIKFNTVLQASGVGAGCYGAADALLPNQLNISWPLTSLVGTGGSTDVVITPHVSVGATETLTLGTALAGASSRLKAAQTIIQTKQDGSNGFGNDTVWYIGKQSNGAGWSSGGWRALFSIGGGGQAPFDDLLSQDIEPSSYPMRFDADMFLFVPQTNVSGAPDAPPPNISLHSFLSAGNVDFFAAAGGPILTPGFQSYGDGSMEMGSATLQRLVGNASIAGISLTANGWEGTAVTLVDGGGSNGGTADPGFLLHRYYVGARCFDAYGGGYQIDSIGTHGEVVTFHVIGDGTHFAYPSAAAGTVPATNQGVVGCGGTGWVNGITWTAGNTVRIGGAGQTVDIEGSTVIAGTITPGTLLGPITLSGTLSGGTITTTTVSGSVALATNGLNSRTFANWFGDTVNAIGQSVVANGTVNDQPALTTATTLAQSKGEALFLPAQNNSGAAAVYNLTTDWKPASGDLSVDIAPGATFSGAGLPKFDNQFPHYAYPIFASKMNTRTYNSFFNPYTNVDLEMDIAVNTGTANVVAFQGVGISTTTTSPTWGGDFVCEQQAASGAVCTGVEIDTINTISGGNAYGLLVAAQGSFNSNSAITVGATASGVQWTNGLVFQQTVVGNLAPATNALIETTAFTGSTGYGMRMRGLYSVAEMTWPSLLVGATPATLDARLEILGSNSGSGVTLAVVANDGGTTTNSPMVIDSLGTSSLSFGTGNGTQFQIQDGGASTINYGYVKGGSTGTGVTYACGFTGDANVNCTMAPRGTGAFVVQNTGGGASAQFTAASGTLSRILVSGAPTNTPVGITVAGTVTDLAISASAAKEVQFGSHLAVTSGGVPTAAACAGTGSIAGFDSLMKVTEGSSTSTTCTIAFGATWAAIPICLVTVRSGAAVMGPISWVESTGSIVITSATTDTLGVFDIACYGTS